MKRFNQKVVIVTGGSYGLGRAIAIDFAKEGAKVVIADIDTPRGEETLTMVNNAGGEAIFVKTDVSKETEVKTMVQKTIGAFGKLDFIITMQVLPKKLSRLPSRQKKFLMLLSIPMLRECG